MRNVALRGAFLIHIVNRNERDDMGENMEEKDGGIPSPAFGTEVWPPSRLRGLSAHFTPRSSNDDDDDHLRDSLYISQMVFLDDSESLDYAKLVRLPPDSIRVEDPDEEIFLLYTQLLAVDVQDGSTPFTGLGSVDSKADVLTVSFDLPRRDFTAPMDDENSPSRRKKKPRTKKPTHMAEETLEIELIQDKTVLRSKRGDTSK